MQQVANPEEPGPSGLGAGAPGEGHRAEQLRDKSFDDQEAKVVLSGQLGAQPSAIAGNVGGAAYQEIRNEGPAFQLDDEAFGWIRSELIPMARAGRLRNQGGGSVRLEAAALDCFSIVSVQHDVEGRVFVGVGRKPDAGGEPGDGQDTPAGEQRRLRGSAQNGGGCFHHP